MSDNTNINTDTSNLDNLDNTTADCYFPSIPVSTKDLRLLLRRINKSIRDLNSDLNDYSFADADTNSLQSFEAQQGLDTDSLNKLSDLIQLKAMQQIDVLPSNEPVEQENTEDPFEIMKQLL